MQEKKSYCDIHNDDEILYIFFYMCADIRL